MSLNFDELRLQNVKRCRRWHPGGVRSWSLSDWGVAMGGECGEALNVVKKLNRARDGLAGNNELPQELRDKLAREISDTVIYADLLCEAAGIDLGEAIRATFNRKSDEVGFPEKL